MTDQATTDKQKHVNQKDRRETQPLTQAISGQLRLYCQQGYAELDRGDSKAAIRQFYSAWTLLPKPQTQWQEAGWVLTALGDAYFNKGDYQNGQEALLSALHCPKAYGNPVIHLRLGQCQYELGNREVAHQQFQLTLKHGGEALFENENNKYLQLLNSDNTG